MKFVDEVIIRVEAGNGFGTPEYFSFYTVEVTAIRFVRPGGAAR